MDIKNMDFIQLLPLFMKEDEAVIGLSKGVDEVVEELAAKIDAFTTWDKLDKMSAAELDCLAEELHISWYDTNSPIDIKRKIIKDSDIVHSKLGTNWAALQVINTYFGEGRIIDWYEYGGNPGHFKIETVNQSILNEKSKDFIDLLEKVKRKSAHLDKIELISDGGCGIKVFIATAEIENLITVAKR